MMYFCGTRHKKTTYVIRFHPGIDPGPLVPNSDTLTTRPRCQVVRGSNITEHIGQTIQSIGNVRIRIQGKNFEFFYIVDVVCSIYLYLVLRQSVLMNGQ